MTTWSALGATPAGLEVPDLQVTGLHEADLWDTPELKELIQVLRADSLEFVEERSSAGTPPTIEDRRARAYERAQQWFQDHHAQQDNLGGRQLDRTQEDALLDAAIKSVFGTPWERWLRPEYSDVFINGPDIVYAIIRETGKKVKLPAVARSNQELVEQIRAVASHGGRTIREISDANPTLNLRLNDGSRLHAVLSPLTNQTTVSIRRHDPELARLEDLYEAGMMSKEMLLLLRAIVAAKMTVVVVGSVGSGKTTLVRAMLNEADPDERICTVEDDQELSLSNWPDLNPDVVEYEARPANIEGQGEFTMEMCLRETLRQNQSRVVVGEVRGGEVVSFLRAISNGLSGSMCTIHANSTQEAFGRMVLYSAFAKETIPQDMVRELVAAAVDFVIYVQKGPDGIRRLSSIREVCRVGDTGAIESNEIFAPKGFDDARGTPTQIVPTDGVTRVLEAHGWDRGSLRNPGTWTS